MNYEDITSRIRSNYVTITKAEAREATSRKGEGEVVDFAFYFTLMGKDDNIIFEFPREALDNSSSDQVASWIQRQFDSRIETLKKKYAAEKMEKALGIGGHETTKSINEVRSDFVLDWMKGIKRSS